MNRVRLVVLNPKRRFSAQPNPISPSNSTPEKLSKIPKPQRQKKRETTFASSRYGSGEILTLTESQEPVKINVNTLSDSTSHSKLSQHSIGRLSKEQKHLLDVILEGNNVYFTGTHKSYPSGKAGTGKTKVIQALTEELQQRHVRFAVTVRRSMTYDL